MIRNIIFDMGHVLMWYRPQEACSELLKDEADAQALCAAFFGGPAWVEIDHGRLDNETFTGAVKALLEERLRPAVDALYRGMPENILVPVEGMAGIVDAVLDRGFRVYLLSNAGRFMSRRRDVIPHIARFHGVMFSGDEGVVKPDIRLYERLAQRYGLKAEECFFIDDREDNIQTAAALGWRTCRFSGDAEALKRDLDAL
ncbi:MAG: HAD family phosphatase [Clostridiales bacterium]|nr:HAD family phosphatase [Clostridiales bacterium]